MLLQLWQNVYALYNKILNKLINVTPSINFSLYGMLNTKVETTTSNQINLQTTNSNTRQFTNINFSTTLQIIQNV